MKAMLFLQLYISSDYIISIHSNITDHYRVKAMRNNGLIADYILKVYEDKMKLFTSNGMLSTSFSCNLKEIYKIKYTSSKHSHKSMNGYLSITIKNAKSKYVTYMFCTCEKLYA